MQGRMCDSPLWPATLYQPPPLFGLCCLFFWVGWYGCYERLILTQIGQHWSLLKPQRLIRTQKEAFCVCKKQQWMWQSVSIQQAGIAGLAGMRFPLAKETLFLYLKRWHAERMKTLNKHSWPNRGIAWVYRLVLPTGWRGLFHNVLSLSPYLELRERFPYLTHSCKSQLNSSNSGNDLQTRLLSILAQRSCQGWGRLIETTPYHLLELQERLPWSRHTRTHTYTNSLKWWGVCGFWRGGASHGGIFKPHKSAYLWLAQRNETTHILLSLVLLFII